MRHFYTQILSYNPVNKKVTSYEPVSEDDIFNARKQSELFSKVWGASDHICEVVLAFTVTRDMYQLSETKYRYVKEDPYSATTIKKGSVLRAIDEYRFEHKISFDF